MRLVELPDNHQNGFYRKFLEKQGSAAVKQNLPSEDRKEETDRRKILVCRQCRKHVTDESRRVSIAGAHRHTFANPHGHVYDIVCFDSAEGCLGAGPPSDEFTWFKGYTWQIVICAGCMAHLGWFFLSSEQHHFYGLIFDRLVSP